MKWVLTGVVCLAAWVLVAVPGRTLCAATLDRTIAKLNQDIITESDLAAAVAEIYGFLTPDPSMNIFDSASSETVGGLFDRKLLIQEAERLGVKATESDLHTQVEQMVQEIRNKFSSESEFRKELAKEGISLDRLQKDLMRRAREDFQVYHAISSRFSVTKSDIDAYESKQGAGGVSYRLRRLGVAVKGGKTGDASSAVKLLVAKIVTEGITFDEGIRKYSQIPGAAEDGGDLGYMSADKLAPAVLAAVKELKSGQASSPVIAGGFANVFYLESKKGARSGVLEERFFENRQSLLKELRRKANLLIFDERLYPLLPQDYIREGAKSLVKSSATPATGAEVERPGSPGKEEGNTKEPAGADRAPRRGWGGLRAQ